MASEFIWYELLTPDANAAQRFYADVVGWTFAPTGQTGMDYRMITAVDGEQIGGLLQLTEQMRQGGARPVWLGYISVADVDAEVKAIEAEGGRTQMPPRTVEGAGRMAMVTDPHGAPFYVMTPTPPPGQPKARSTAFARMTVGHCGWNELSTDDPKAALAFYTRRFGWADGGMMPLGNGDYQIINDADGMIGGIMRVGNSDQPSMWSYYFRVADIDAATRKTASSGGSIVHGPEEVPGGDHIAVGRDPQGAMFAIVGARRA